MIPSDDCELLSELEKHGSITLLAEALKLDKAFISRKIGKIALAAPVLEKVGGKWSLTSRGEQLVRWFRESVERQKQILENNDELRIYTTQTISDRILTPLLAKIQKKTKLKKVKILTGSPNVEEALLSKKIDLAFVCDIPRSPEIRYRRLFKAPVIGISSTQKKELSSLSLDELMEYPYVIHSDMTIRGMLKIENEIAAPVAEIDHISGVRQAVVSGHGWSILPLYAVEQELKNKTLQQLPNVPTYVNEDFQLWWVPGRFSQSMILEIGSMLAT